MIEDYSFGNMVIDGERYDYDVEVRWNGKVQSWWREDGHVFDVPDLERALKVDPDVVVLGTGNSGRADVTTELENRLKDEGVEYIEGKTQDVVEDFNQISEDGSKRVVGLFHLTC